MKEAEGIVVFPDDAKPSTKAVKGEKKSKKGVKSLKSPDPPIATETGNAEKASPEVDGTDLDEAAFLMCEAALSKVWTGGLSAECCLLLLDSEGLSKQVRVCWRKSSLTRRQLFSEDLLSTCASIIKEQTLKTVFSVIEGLAGDSTLRSFFAVSRVAPDFPSQESHRNSSHTSLIKKQPPPVKAKARRNSLPFSGIPFFQRSHRARVPPFPASHR